MTESWCFQIIIFAILKSVSHISDVPLWHLSFYSDLWFMRCCVLKLWFYDCLIFCTFLSAKVYVWCLIRLVELVIWKFCLDKFAGDCFLSSSADLVFGVSWRVFVGRLPIPDIWTAAIWWFGFMLCLRVPGSLLLEQDVALSFFLCRLLPWLSHSWRFCSWTDACRHGRAWGHKGEHMFATTGGRKETNKCFERI